MYETSTIEEICADYLEEKRERRKPNTVYGYESSINLHVIPRWGDMKVSEITRRAVQDWVDELAPNHGAGGAEKAYKLTSCQWCVCNWR